MAKTLQELLSPQVVAEAIRKVKAPVHWLVNVDGDPHQVGAACGRWKWYSANMAVLDPNRPAINPITCPRCLDYLASLANKPIIVEAQ